jgi:hypothetical protein
MVSDGCVGVLESSRRGWSCVQFWAVLSVHAASLSLCRALLLASCCPLEPARPQGSASQAAGEQLTVVAVAYG